MKFNSVWLDSFRCKWAPFWSKFHFIVIFFVTRIQLNDLKICVIALDSLVNEWFTLCELLEIYWNLKKTPSTEIYFILRNILMISHIICFWSRYFGQNLKNQNLKEHALSFVIASVWCMFQLDDNGRKRSEQSNLNGNLEGKYRWRFWAQTIKCHT